MRGASAGRLRLLHSAGGLGAWAWHLAAASWEARAGRPWGSVCARGAWGSRHVFGRRRGVQGDRRRAQRVAKGLGCWYALCGDDGRGLRPLSFLTGRTAASPSTHHDPSIAPRVLALCLHRRSLIACLGLPLVNCQKGCNPSKRSGSVGPTCVHVFESSLPFVFNTNNFSLHT